MARSFSPQLLDHLRSVPLADVLGGLGYHIAIDRDYAPTKDGRSQRWIVSSAAGASSELVVTGLKWFDTRDGSGGGGAVDLVMHLERLSFVAAVKRLAGVLKT